MKTFLAQIMALGVVAAVGFAAFGPNRPGRAYVSSWIQARAIDGRWAWLTTRGGRIGSQSASAVVLVEFGDYQCPWCREAQKSVDTLLQKYPNVALVYHQFPLAIHPRARLAAIASLCAQKQGAFKAMHGFLYTENDWQRDSSPGWVSIAALTDVSDTAAFGACLRQERVATLDTSIAVGHELGVTGTPTFLSKNGFLDRAPTTENLRALLGLPAVR